MKRRLPFALTATLLLAIPRVGAAQHAEHAHGAPAEAGSARPEISELALQQIREVEASVRSLSTPEAAQAAGFHPVLGNIPGMGVHYVHRARMQDGFRMSHPDHLMFSPVAGEMKLVGAAYAMSEAPDFAPPAGFDGDLDRWHDHPQLAAGENSLHMLHVWFIDSPDGPFAGRNPWLAFLATGVTPPNAARRADPAASATIRELGAALALATADPAERPMLARFASADLLQRLDEHRAAIRALIPELESGHH